MQTLLSNLSKCGLPAFEFAGMHFPKHVWTLPKGTPAQRLARRKPVVCGDYYHAPKPLTARGDRGKGFYLESDGMPGLRWDWCDRIDRTIRHTGWFTDDEGFSETIRGVVFRLSHGRGYLSGHSMGKWMSSYLEYHVYSNQTDAARVADRMAEHAAEREREYQAKQDAECVEE